MSAVERAIVNELGNVIGIAVTRDQRGITVAAIGPTSEVEHTWTPMEAATILELVSSVLDDDTAQTVYDL